MKVRVQALWIPILAGGITGFIYNSLCWTHHWRYINPHWLGPLIGADGEKGYDAMMYESMIDFALGVTALYLLAMFTWSLRSHPDTSAKQ